MNLSFSVVSIWMLAMLLGGVAYSRKDNRQNEAFSFALSQAIVLLPRIVMALLTATFIGALLPPDSIAGWLGEDSGLAGIAVAAVAGALVPGGPVIAFPIAVLLKASGAGVPQIVTFVTAWSIFAAHRIMLFELTVVGWRFTVLRLLVCLPAPIIAGVVAQQLIA